MKDEPQMTGLEVALRCVILVLALALFAAMADKFSFPDHGGAPYSDGRR